MKAGFIQYDVQHVREDNFRKIEHAFTCLDCDLAVLPELCTCGYLFKDRNALAEVAEPVPGGISSLKMLELSEKHHCAILFGVPEKTKDGLYNTAAVVKNGKYIGKYRKIHLSDLEKRLFNRGTENPVFDLDGVKIGIQICFDLWFPEISGEQVRQGAGILCVLANFGGKTTFEISRTRAVENLTPLILCNRTGRENLDGIDATFLGKSTILDQAGKRLRTAGSDRETAAFCEIAPAGKRSNAICADFDAEFFIRAGKYS